MPQLTLLSFPLNRKILELTNFIFELYNKPNLSWRAKVAHYQKTDHLKKALSAQALLIEPHLAQLLLLNGCDLHNIADI